MTHHAAFGLAIEDLDVMIIEESRTAQTMLRSMLAGFGAKRIRSADSATEALQMMIAEPPNLVLTAWAVGSQTGQKLLSVLRHKRMEPLCYLPIIVVTAHATLKVVDDAFSAGCTNLLVKPVSPAAMLRRVEWVLNDAREFVDDGSSLAISGVKTVLETRVRKRRLSTIIASNAAVDALMTGDIDEVLDDYEDMAGLQLARPASAQTTPRAGIAKPPEKVASETQTKTVPKPKSRPEFDNVPEDEGKQQPYWYGWDLGSVDLSSGNPPACQPSEQAA